MLLVIEQVPEQVMSAPEIIPPSDMKSPSTVNEKEASLPRFSALRYCVSIHLSIEVVYRAVAIKCLN